MIQKELKHFSTVINKKEKLVNFKLYEEFTDAKGKETKKPKEMFESGLVAESKFSEFGVRIYEWLWGFVDIRRRKTEMHLISDWENGFESEWDEESDGTAIIHRRMIVTGDIKTLENLRNHINQPRS
jgi:hypothetical protein